MLDVAEDVADAKVKIICHKDLKEKILTDCDADAADLSCVMIWRSSGKAPADVKEVFKMVETHASEIKEKEKNMDKSIEEMESKPGSIGSLGFGLPVDTFCGKDLRFREDDGARCWTTSCRLNRTRMKPGEVPLAGVGAVLIPTKGSVFVCAWPVSVLLSRAISLDVMPAHFESPAGEKFFKECGIGCYLSEEEMMFVPSGYLTAIMNFKTAKTKITPDDVSHVLAAPIITDEENTLPSNVKTAVASWHNDHFLRRADSAMWKARQAFFDKLFND